MLAYLINATIIWVLALALFEWLFRRSGHHGANRAYLLGTLLLGIMLPLVAPVMETTSIVNPGVRITAHVSQPLPARIVETASANATQHVSKPALTLADWLLLLYAAGASVFAGKLLYEGWILFRLARRSRQLIILNHAVHVTYGRHALFSFFNRVFLSRNEDFNEEELQMVFRHELRHAQLMHSTDVLLLETLRFLFWFHPAVWLYARRLRAVHEFQADASVQENRAAYGHFLLHQALLGNSPSLATSIIHSPIKMRIQMLTQTTTRSSWIYLAVLPLMAISFLCCTRQREKTENASSSKASVGGNVFEMSNMVQQPILVRDGASGKVDTTFMTVLPQPVTMNGEAIYQTDNVTKQVQYVGSESSATLDLFNRIKGKLGKLSDGTYFLEMPYLIVGKDGKVVYAGEADIHGGATTITIGEGADSMIQVKDGIVSFSLPEEPKDGHDINDRTRRDIVSAIHDALTEDLKFSPAQKDGKAVIAYAEESGPFNQGGHIVVRNGKPQLINSTTVFKGDAGLPPHKVDREN